MWAWLAGHNRRPCRCDRRSRRRRWRCSCRLAQQRRIASGTRRTKACRTPLLDLIRDERVGIDGAFWFMEDARYTAALDRKIAEGVPVQVLVHPRANSSYPLNADRLRELRDARIPMHPEPRGWAGDRSIRSCCRRGPIWIARPGLAGDATILPESGGP
jgi:hypothetical protein